MPDRPEHWSVEAGTRDVARLDIPPDALHDRRFEIFCSFVVSNKVGRDDAWHELRVLVDGALEWSRRAATHGGANDSLELRLHRLVPAGRALRLNAITALSGAHRVSLRITADEER
jgi:hypothetical protein